MPATRMKPKQALSTADKLFYAAEAEECRRSFKAFVRAAWKVLEPGRDVRWNWHMDALIEHLQALLEGQITRLVINIAPGHTKSTIVSQCFPAWVWTRRPEMRMLCASTDLTLAIRDNRNCRYLIESEWYRACYGREFRLNDTQFDMSDDQNAKSYFENDRKGYRQALSVGGKGIGKRGDILLCLCYNAEVTTDKGRLRIGDIVEQRLPVRILAYDHSTNAPRWQRIERYEKNPGPGRACVRVTFSDGRSVETTADHPVYVVGRGYVPAGQLSKRDEVVTDEGSLRVLRSRTRTQAIKAAEAETSILQQGLLRRLAARARQLLRLRAVRQNIQTSSKACGTNRPPVLQSSLSWRVEQGGKQPSLPGWKGCPDLPAVRQNVLSQARRGSAPQREVLFLLLQEQSVSSERTAQLIRLLRILWNAHQAQTAQASRKAELLLSQSCQSSSQRVYQRREQSTLCGWDSGRAVSLRIHQACTADSGARPESMLAVPYDTGRARQRTQCPSHRLRYSPQRASESCDTLSLVSWENAWLTRAAVPVEALLVRSVEPIPTPEYVYNLRVAEDHNYFANGVLVHNCDDPHDPREGDIEREKVIEWHKQTWVSRLNDQEHGLMVVVGQRIHDEDLCGYLLKLGGWEHLCLPEEFDPTRRSSTSIGWCDPRDEAGELLWPDKFPRAVVTKLKDDLGSYGYAAQYDQAPVPAKGAVFQEAWKRYFEIQGDYYILHTKYGTRKPVPIRACRNEAVCDLATSEREKSDFFVIQTWAITPENECLLLNQLRGHFNNPDQQKEAIKLYEIYAWSVFWVEQVAYQLAYIQQMRSYEIKEEVEKDVYRVVRVVSIPVMPWKPFRDKEVRASVAAVKMEAGDMYWLAGAAYLQELEPEVFKFPKSKKKDQVDCLSMISDILSSPRGPVMWSPDGELPATAVAPTAIATLPRSPETAPTAGQPHLMLTIDDSDGGWQPITQDEGFFVDWELPG